MTLPEALTEGEWPFQSEVESLERAHALHEQLDQKLQSLTRDLRAHRFYPRKPEARQVRVRVFHTFVPPVVGGDDVTPSPGRWTLHVEAVDATSRSDELVNLSHYFRKISIQLDPRLHTDAFIEWNSFHKTSSDVNALEITRMGQTAQSVRIRLVPAQTIDRYAISPLLAGAIGQYLAPVQAFTKQDIVMATWEYIKRRDLIKEDDCRVAVCDDTLIQLFNCVSLPFTSIVVALKPHLSAAGPIDLEYTLRLGEATPATASASADNSNEDAAKEKGSAILDEQFFDVDACVVDEVDKTRERVLTEWEELQQEQQKELSLLKQQELDLLDRLQEATRKYEWMTQFAEDPCGFIKDVTQSQRADQQLLAAEAETDEFNLPHAHQFSQPWVREVVTNLLVPPSAN